MVKHLCGEVGKIFLSIKENFVKKLLIFPLRMY